MMKHLKGGVKKGAFDEATAQKKFEAWKADKQNGLNKIAEAEAKAKKDAAAAQLKAEKAQNEEQAKKVAEKKAAEAAAKAEEEAAKAAEAAAAEAPAPLKHLLLRLPPLSNQFIGLTKNKRVCHNRHTLFFYIICSQ